MCPSSERVNKICAPHTVDTREMTVVHDDVSRIVSRQQELQERVIQMRASVDELRSAVYNQHEEVIEIVTRQHELQEHVIQMHELGNAVYNQHDKVRRIVTRQQELPEHVIQMHELGNVVYNQHDEVRRIVTRQQELPEQMSTRLGTRWNDLKESRGTSLEEPKESSKTYVWAV